MSLIMCAAGLQKLSKKILTIPRMHCTPKNILHTSYCHMNFMKLLRRKTSSLSTSGLEDNSYQTGPKDGFIPIYRLPSIGNIVGFNRAKRLQTVVFCLAAPISIALSFADIVSSEASMIFCIAGLTITIKLYAIGFWVKNIVGFVYVSPDMSSVQISYLDHHGKRREDIFESSDLVHQSELPSHFMERYYFHIQKYSQPSAQLYKLSLAYGHIIDMDRFTEIFGKLDK